MTSGRSRLAKNLVRLGAGTAIAQAVTLALTPIVTRLYTPTDMGVLATLVAIASIVFPVATLRLDLAILLPKETDEAADLVSLLCRISFWVTAGAAFVLVISKLIGAGVIKSELTYGMLASVAPAVWFNCLYSAFAAYATRKSAFGRLAVANVASSLLSNGARVFLGVAGWGAWGLWLGNVLQTVTSMVLAGKGAPKFWRTGNPQPRLLLKKYREMPVYRAPQDLFNALAANAVNIIMLIVYGASQVGLYSLAFKLAAAPVELIKGTIRSVYYKHAVDLPDARSLYRDTLGLTAILFVAALPAVVLMFSFGDEMFAWAFGEQWRSAGSYAAWTMLGLGSSLANAPVVTVVPIIKWNKNLLIYEVVSSLIKCLIVVCSCLTLDVYNTVIVVSILSVISNGALIAALLQKTRNLMQSGTPLAF